MSDAPVFTASRVSQIDGVVTGVAVGVPVARQPSGSATDAALSNLGAGMSLETPEVAVGWTYSPMMAKMFARYDIDKSGTISPDELKQMLADLKLDLDLDTVMSSFGERSHREGSINLSDWEKGLDESIKAAIEKKLDEEAGNK